MKWLKLFDENIEAWLINFLLVNIVFWIFLQVVMRYVFSNSLPWSEEFVRWCFIWFIWVGVSYGFRTRKHIAVTALINLFPKRVFDLISIAVNLVVLWCMVKMFLYGWSQISSPIIARQSSIVLYWPLTETRVSMQWLYASLPAGALLSALRLVQNLYQDISSLVKVPVKSTDSKSTLSHQGGK
ncbi:TRAP transporter small permease [Vibrio sp. JC009]|uniref:TRAP transporter small permease n=1 Tax=Vibrio sp. JC009 TaxID=2912314 RepID=UPI0023B1B2FD|nr:TRAP transporter small permease [Vibrio sp. JC009]WED23423.1 TRAP transporter small permease [Vibrio sp. JC009]